jgi:hypothetical protein
MKHINTLYDKLKGFRMLRFTRICATDNSVQCCVDMNKKRNFLPKFTHICSFSINIILVKQRVSVNITDTYYTFKGNFAGVPNVKEVDRVAEVRCNTML